MTSNPLKQKKIILGGVILILGLCLWLLSSPKPPVMPFPGVTILPNPMVISEFELISHQGKPYTNEDLKGKWSFMFFGYTHCPDVCPTTLALLNNFYKKQEQQDNKNVIFVTADPIRDSVEVMAEQIDYYNKNFTGLTANDVPTIKKLGEEVGVIFDYETLDHDLIRDYSTLTSESEYAVEHNASIFIIDPKGRLVADILPPHTLERVSKTFSLVEEYY